MAAVPRFVLTYQSNPATLATVDGNPYPVIPGSGGGGSSELLAFISVKDFGAVGDGVTDDSGAIQAGVNATSASGQWLWFPTGTYVLKHGISVPSGTRLWGYGSTILTELATGAIDLTGVAFLAESAVSGTSFALHANVPNGASTIDVTSGTFVAGNVVHVVDGNLSAQYTVQSVAAHSGYQTITLDRATLYPFTSATGTIAQVTTLVEDVYIQGLTMTGLCSRYVEFFINNGSVLRDCIVTDASGNYAADTLGPVAVDSGSLGCIAENCTFIGPRGLLFNSCEACSAGPYVFQGHNVTQVQGEGTGCNFNLAAACLLWGVRIGGAFEGVYMHGIAPAPNYPDSRQAGTYNCTVQGGTISGCTNSGVHTDQCDMPLIQGVAIVGNAAGVSFNDVTTNPAIKNCSVVQSYAGANIIVNAPTVDIDDCDVSNLHIGDGVNFCTGIFLSNVGNDPPSNTVSNYRLSRIRTSYNPGTAGDSFVIVALDAGAGCNMTLDGFDIVGCITGEGAATKMNIRNGNIKCDRADGADAIAILASSNGELILENVTATAPSGSTCFASSANTTVWLLDRVVPGGSGTGFAFGGAVNKGTVTLNGSGSGSLAWPNATAESVLTLTLQTASSLGNVAVTVTPGTGFTLASDSGDDGSTFLYTVQ